MLWSHLDYYSPEFLLELSLSGKIAGYLDEKAGSVSLPEKSVMYSKEGYLLLEETVKKLTADLLPSGYRYVYQTLKEEFPREFKQILKSGLIVYHVVNMLNDCREILGTQGTWEEDDRGILHLVIESIQQYLGAKHGWQHL